MAAICFYLQIHQPFRLRKYTAFDSTHDYFLQQLTEQAYLPVTQILLEQIEKHHGRFRFALSITGTALEIFEAHAPNVLQNLQALANSGGVELLAETYHHSLAAIYSPTEFADQVALHRTAIKRLFNQSPTTFRNTELIYSDAIADLVAQQNFTTILAECSDPLLANRSAAFPYRTHNAGGGGNLTLLLRNPTLSNSITVQAVSQIGGQLCNLFLPFESLTPSFLLEILRQTEQSKFLLPSEIAAADSLQHSAGPLSIPQPTPWTANSNTLNSWLGNPMQQNAATELYKFESLIKQQNSPNLLNDWRRLTTSDHFLHMSTHPVSDTSYDAYINFMNILDNLRARLRSSSEPRSGGF